MFASLSAWSSSSSDIVAPELSPGETPNVKVFHQMKNTIKLK
jgi:hypothetical protein